jgi:hypothetical protein
LGYRPNPQILRRASALLFLRPVWNDRAKYCTEKVLFSPKTPPVSGVRYGGSVFLLPCEKTKCAKKMVLKSPQM